MSLIVISSFGNNRDKILNVGIQTALLVPGYHPIYVIGSLGSSVALAENHSQVGIGFDPAIMYRKEGIDMIFSSRTDFGNLKIGTYYEFFPDIDYKGRSITFDYNWSTFNLTKTSQKSTLNLTSGAGIGLAREHFSPEIRSEISFNFGGCSLSLMGNLKYRGELSDQNPHIIDKDFKCVPNGYVLFNINL